MHIEQKLQQLIIELNDKKKSHQMLLENAANFYTKGYHSCGMIECDFLIQKLTEILNEGSVAASSIVENDNETKSAEWRHNLRG